MKGLNQILFHYCHNGGQPTPSDLSVPALPLYARLGLWRLSQPFGAGTHQPCWLSYGDNAKPLQCCSNKTAGDLLKHCPPVFSLLLTSPRPLCSIKKRILYILPPTQKQTLSIWAGISHLFCLCWHGEYTHTHVCFDLSWELEVNIVKIKVS